MTHKKRNYRQEYDRYHGSKKQKLRRAGRNAARRRMIANGKAHKGDGKDVAHRDNNPRNNNPKNIKMASYKSNRSFKRNKNAGRA
jgi:hypothetical protein